MEIELSEGSLKRLRRIIELKVTQHHKHLTEKEAVELAISVTWLVYEREGMRFARQELMKDHLATCDLIVYPARLHNYCNCDKLKSEGSTKEPSETTKELPVPYTNLF